MKKIVEKNSSEKNMPTKNKSPSMYDLRSGWDNLLALGGDKAILALGSAYTTNPYLLNQRTKRVATPPFQQSRELLENALKDIQNSELLLRQTSRSLFVNYPLLKLNSMYADLLSYRFYPYSKYTTAKEIKSEEYKKERKIVSQWLDKLQPKRTLQNIVLATQWEGKKAYYIRDSKNENGQSDYVYFQEIPSDYIKIVGWNTDSKFTVSFNFTYFWQPGTSTEQFPPIFKKYYEEMNGLTGVNNNGNRFFKVDPNKLSPLVEIYNKENQWFYWHILPLDECFVFSQDESQSFQIPNTAGLFLQAKDLQDYAYLQQQLLQLPLSGVVTGTIPMTKDSNGAIATDNYALGTGAYTFFTNLFNSVAPNGIKLFLNPATDMNFFKFDGDTINNSQIMGNALQQFNSIAGVGGINSTTDKPNISQVKTQQMVETAYVSRFYDQFVNAINIWLKKKLNLKFTWRVKMKGGIFTDQTDFARVEKGLTLGQNYLLPEYLSYFDLTLDDIESIQEEVIDSDVYGKLEVLQNAFTTSQQLKAQDSPVGNEKQIDKKTGRPNADLNNIESDSTAKSIENGSNTKDGRETMSVKYCVECGTLLDNKAINGCFCCEECAEENKNRLGVE